MIFLVSHFVGFHFVDIYLFFFLQETKLKYETLVSETKSIKSQLNTLEKACESTSKEKQRLQNQIRELEHQYSEISHEKQLLQEEIAELKTSPVIMNKTPRNLDELNLFKSEHASTQHSVSSNSTNTNDSNKIESNTYISDNQIELLQEKLRQYKSLDLTNRTSIEFYESELQKMRNKNEKLNRKLDETLVTLNHCAELSSSTEIEYLKNVLYNYMLGKESLVLARVIAAVCKFDKQQTEMVLAKEQQKQTLVRISSLL